MRINECIITMAATGLVLASGLSGCSSGGGSGDTTAPTAVTTPATNSSLGVHDTIVITFSESMDTSSLTLGGSMAADSDGGVWSTTNEANDTLTISPGSNWHTATDTLTVDASDKAGNSLSTLNLNYTGIVQFTSFQKADVVIGQTDFTSFGANQGGSADANTFDYPYGSPGYGGGKIYIADYNNNRVLGFNKVPSLNNANADFVLGQSDFTSTGNGTSSSSFYHPVDAFSNGSNLFVSEYDNSRVLLYNSLPSSGPGSADHVIGQPDFSSSSCTAASSSSTCHPSATYTVNGKTIVSDRGNNRILIWNSIPTSDGAGADLVLGQGDFSHNTNNDDNQDNAADSSPTARTLDTPIGIWSDGTRLVVNDSNNCRILIWNTFPTNDFQPADHVLGQSDFTHHASNDDNQDGSADGMPSARTLHCAFGSPASDGTDLIVGDFLNNRVLIWNTFPTSDFQAADVVLGQGDFTHNTANDDNQDGNEDTMPSDRTFKAPTGLTLAGDKLLVNDTYNHRVLVFTSQ